MAPGFVGAPELPRLARCPHPKPVESEEAVHTWLEIPTGFGMEKWCFNHLLPSTILSNGGMLDDAWWLVLSCFKDLASCRTWISWLVDLWWLVMQYLGQRYGQQLQPITFGEKNCTYRIIEISRISCYFKAHNPAPWGTFWGTQQGTSGAAPCLTQPWQGDRGRGSSERWHTHMHKHV